jgi:hypothetical protein
MGRPKQTPRGQLRVFRPAVEQYEHRLPIAESIGPALTLHALGGIALVRLDQTPSRSIHTPLDLGEVAATSGNALTPTEGVRLIHGEAPRFDDRLRDNFIAALSFGEDQPDFLNSPAPLSAVGPLEILRTVPAGPDSTPTFTPSHMPIAPDLSVSLRSSAGEDPLFGAVNAMLNRSGGSSPLKLPPGLSPAASPTGRGLSPFPKSLSP